MSGLSGKKIRLIAVSVSMVCAIMFTALSYSGFREGSVAGGICFAVLALASLVSAYLGFIAGKLADDVVGLRENIRIMNERMARMQKESEKQNPADKYSPSNRLKIQKNTTGSLSADLAETAATRVVQTPPPAVRSEAPSPVAKDFTREIPIPQSLKTELHEKANMTTGSTKRPDEERFFTSSSINIIKSSPQPQPLQSISAGGLHSVCVRRDGTVAASGYGTYGQCNVENWVNMTGVSAGNHHTVGLRMNGTCVATGYSGYGQCEVDSWSDIRMVSAGVGHTVGLKNDGTCVAVGDNTYGQCNVDDWSEVIAISAGYNYTVGLRVDGTIVAVGANTDGQWGAIKWGSICAVAAGGLHTVGLRTDGTCVAVGNNANGQCDISRWNNVVAIAAGNYHTVGLTEGGKVIAAGYNGYGQCDVSNWHDIIAVSAGRNHTLALDKNGTVWAAGDNTYGQTDVSKFRNIKVK